MAKKPAKLWKTSAEDALRWVRGTDLTTLDQSSTPGWSGKRADGEELLAARAPELADLQERLFAHGRTGGDRSVLLVLQGLDTAGKGGIVRHVVGMVDPQGVQHRGFGVPTEEEKQHDYLWRVRNALPRPGYLGVFDRSHHEQVLVVRVNRLEPVGGVARALPGAQRVRGGGGGVGHPDREGGPQGVGGRAEGAPGQSGSNGPTSTGSTTPGTSTSAPGSRSTSRPTRRCWTGPPPRWRPGTSCRRTASGTPASRSPSWPDGRPAVARSGLAARRLRRRDRAGPPRGELTSSSSPAPGRNVLRASPVFSDMRNPAAVHPVILGGDAGAYSLARAFHERYGVRSTVVSIRPTPNVAHSGIIDNVVEPRLADPTVMVEADPPGRRDGLGTGHRAHLRGLVRAGARAAPRTPGGRGAGPLPVGRAARPRDGQAAVLHAVPGSSSGSPTRARRCGPAGSRSATWTCASR